MRSFLMPLVLLLVASGGATASPPLVSPSDEVLPFSGARGGFYCQDPDYAMIYNMSSGFDAEFADDIPMEFIGETIATITLWMGEWYYGGGPYWTEPDGIRVNLYQEACPPEMEPFHTIEVPWNELDKDLIFDTTSSTVYEVRVHLDPPMQVGEVMSIGATALISWGQDEPFTGIVATPMHISFGACPAWFDAEWWGYTRWTAIDEFTMIEQDLAYCLSGEGTEVPHSPPASGLSAYPNPFNPRTKLSAKLEESGDVELRIHDSKGRRIKTLFEGHHEAGELSVVWNGLDERGRRVSSGLYMAVLRMGEVEARERLVLLK